MDITTLLIIVLIELLLGGGWYAVAGIDHEYASLPQHLL